MKQQKKKKLVLHKKMEWQNNHGKIEAANPSYIKLICCGLMVLSDRSDANFIMTCAYRLEEGLLCSFNVEIKY